jgi:hypothetical protein
MPPARHGGGNGGGRSWSSFLVPGLLGCILLGLFFRTPAPFLYGGNGGGGGRGASSSARGGSGAGIVAGGGDVDELSLLLRGKQTQRAAGVGLPHGGKGGGGAAVVAGQPASTEGLLRFFAEAHDKVCSVACERDVEWFGMVNSSSPCKQPDVALILCLPHFCFSKSHPHTHTQGLTERGGAQGGGAAHALLGLGFGQHKRILFVAPAAHQPRWCVHACSRALSLSTYYLPR